ncbi:hypothetical protein [Actinoplanes derwentensis]|uniref:Lipoprotein n=1 Tax=Actinoplanes derwentensis TaxID=113562 RepID=A0A1H2BTZ8_9ACTN|nr:hypothetical protein [Actinoplanes derwentensis]GID83087.1 hypothetical protein Ade03nite_20110 [Actinoplanes derwentensis]SDT61701.1 hypothetical protein SAMN04489716_4893 [Actinoplanes derwentensis]
MRFERALCALVLVGLAGGCTSDPADPAPAASGREESAAAPPAWTEPAAYTFTLVRGCDEAAPVGRYQATVKDGVVTGATRSGGPAASAAPSAEVDLGPVTGDEGEEIDVPALGQLLEMATTAQEDGAEVTTEFDQADGHPVKVSINVTDTPAGAECWTVADYKA